MYLTTEQIKQKCTTKTHGWVEGKKAWVKETHLVGSSIYPFNAGREGKC